MIHTAATQYLNFDRPPAERVHVAMALTHGHEVKLPDDEKPALKGRMDGRIGWASIVAVIDWGRWLVTCPTCNSAQLVDPEDPRFHCYLCQNSDHQGGWVKVHFPKPEVIEMMDLLLSERPESNRHWGPQETLGDLADENMAHGLNHYGLGFDPETMDEKDADKRRRWGVGVPKNAMKLVEEMEKHLTQQGPRLALP